MKAMQKRSMRLSASRVSTALQTVRLRGWPRLVSHGAGPAHSLKGVSFVKINQGRNGRLYVPYPDNS